MRLFLVCVLIILSLFSSSCGSQSQANETVTQYSCSASQMDECGLCPSEQVELKICSINVANNSVTFKSYFLSGSTPISNMPLENYILYDEHSTVWQGPMPLPGLVTPFHFPAEAVPGTKLAINIPLGGGNFVRTITFPGNYQYAPGQFVNLPALPFTLKSSGQILYLHSGGGRVQTWRN